MRCVCCDKRLNDYEATLKSKSTGEYLQTCNSCLDGLGIEVVGRSDLNPFDDQEEDYDEFYEEEQTDQML